MKGRASDQLLVSVPSRNKPARGSAGKQIINPKHTVNATGVKMLAHKGSRQNSCARELKNDAAAKTVAEIQCHTRQTAATPRNIRMNRLVLRSALQCSPIQLTPTRRAPGTRRGWL